jgi:hypothetical protein
VILIYVEQVLNDEHDAQVPVVRILGEQIGHSLVHVVHLVVYDDQVFFCGIQGVEIWQSLDEFDSIYGSVQRLINVVTPSNFIPRGHHHVLNVVDESPDKDGFSTSGWSRDHAGKRVGPRHEVIRKSSAGYFKHEWVARRVNKVRFLCFGLVL